MKLTRRVFIMATGISAGALDDRLRGHDAWRRCTVR
jgi:hypothetical protein